MCDEYIPIPQKYIIPLIKFQELLEKKRNKDVPLSYINHRNSQIGALP